jgi:hypothetical protein
MKYLKYRMKNYVAIVVGLLMGFLIARLLFERPDYLTGFIAATIGFVIVEFVVFVRWLRRNNIRENN